MKRNPFLSLSKVTLLAGLTAWGAALCSWLQAPHPVELAPTILWSQAGTLWLLPCP